jgi:hypothetical protein
MLFELIDSKKICDSCFVGGQIIPFNEATDLSHTWDYSSLLSDKQYALAKLYAGVKNIEDAVSNESREHYLVYKNKVRAYLKSFKTAQVSLDNNCFFDLVPPYFLRELFMVRSIMLNEIFEKYEKPSNYDFLYDLNKMIYEIGEKEVKLDLSKLLETANVSAYKNVDKIKKKVKYNMYGAITGRLTTEQDSFPILTLSKNLRGIVQPTNDFLLELDFNAFEPRILIALSGKEQPKEDLHDWNKDNIFLGMSRDDSKKKFLAWLYDSKGSVKLTDSQKRKVNSLYGKDEIKKKYYDGNLIKNHYGREIKSDEDHALNYIVQSTAADIFLRQAIKVNNLLHGKKTFIKFLIHDSIILDVSKEDVGMLKDIFETFSTTDLGKIMIKKKLGKNFGEMKKI